MLMRTREVDFNHVQPEHAKIDRRLANWARWSNNRGSPAVCAMFALYRADNFDRLDSTQPPPIDHLDAQRVQKGVGALPGPHRLALSWCYIKRNNPRKAAQTLGESLEGLAQLIRDGRQMLINRRI
jgi:DNA-directed RNA polymerase specialized sigma24 family protein